MIVGRGCRFGIDFVGKFVGLAIFWSLFLVIFFVFVGLESYLRRRIGQLFVVIEANFEIICKNRSSFDCWIKNKIWRTIFSLFILCKLKIKNWIF